MSYTAAQLARACRIARRTLLAELVSIPPRVIVITHGNPAAAWALEDLPARRRSAITQAASERGCRDVHSFITAAPSLWQPPIPLSEIAPESIAKAEKLRRVLHAAITLRNDPGITSREIEFRIQSDYRAQFGHDITDRTARALLKRTIERDHFAENFDRLEIYLDGNCKRKSSEPAEQIISTADEFRELHAILASFKTAVAPTDMERENLLHAAFQILKAHTDAGLPEKPMRLRLLVFLWKHAPFLSCSKNALRVGFAEKFKHWQNECCKIISLRDERKAKRGIPAAPPIPQDFLDLVAAHAIFRAGGRVSQSAREMREVLDGGCDPELEILIEALESDPAIPPLIQHNSANKSYVNARLRLAVRDDVRMAEPHRLGGRTLNSARAALERHYNGIPSGYCFSADDVTLPVWWYVPDGNGWFTLTRGQCLIVIDNRSLRVLGFSLQPDRNYSSPVIHTVFTRVFAQHGVPRKLYLEQGIWKNAKLITGGAKSQTRDPDYVFMPHSWADTETGLGRLGIEFIHAIRPRSKLVERVIGLLQDLMHGERGYGGREERHDLPEPVKRAQDDVRFKREHPGKFFYDFDQWEARLTQICDKYNRTPQQGKILAGISPDEAHEKLQSADEAKRPLLFDASARHLLAHYKVEKQTGRDGITITIGGKQWTYRNEQLGRDKFKTKVCWFNPDDPSVIVVTDTNMKNPYSVELARPVAALDPDPENFEQELRRVADYEKYGKARYQVLKGRFQTQFRKADANRATIETGIEIRQQREVIDNRRKETQTRRTRVHRRAAELELPAGVMDTGADGDEGTRLMLEARREHESKKGKETV